MTDAREIDAATAVFEAERSRLTGLAYRMTGTPDDAHDVLQDVWLRWQGADRGGIENPAAWLTTVTTRLAIDRLTSARARRETYVGPWVPEPFTDTSATDPSEVVAADETLTLGFLRVLETLAPVERAVFLLHDVFAYPFDEVAEAVGRSPAAARQIAKRARDRVRDGRPRVEPEPSDVESLSQAFMAAAFSGDVDRLAALLTDDITFVSDGGAERRAARRIVRGPDRVARLFVNLAKRVAAPGFEPHHVEVNGQSAVYMTENGEPSWLMMLGWRDGRAAEAIAILNPQKLARFHRHWAGER